MSKYKVLVPTDFTGVADAAVDHAVKIARKFNGEVFLLHIVGSQKEVEKISPKLDALAQEYQKKYNINIHPIIRIGNIFDDIGDVAAEINARLIVMGTHGMRGIQYIVGSNALRVITHSKVPFVVVQEKKYQGDYKHIITPIDYSEETKQKLTIVSNMAKHFNAKVHIVIPKEDDEFLQSKLNLDLAFAKNYLEEKGVEYDIQYAEDDIKFAKYVIRYAAKFENSLIAIISSPDQMFVPGVLGGGDEQMIIANDPMIPVLIMNPTQEFLATSVLFS